MQAVAEGDTVAQQARCASCGAAVELVCKRRTGFWGYPEHHEYFCPACGKQNHARTTGTIVATRLPAAAPPD